MGIVTGIGISIRIDIGIGIGMGYGTCGNSRRGYGKNEAYDSIIYCDTPESRMLCRLPCSQ